ncbi:MAG: MerR family transcriptional regulator, partial [Chloroflexota bacterium]|nr:MerR family transcriptional regulator [Chloroflexota bacterium]
MTERRANNGGGAPAGGRLGLKELTEAAGVSVRTVRYYIAEGLLPPPAGAGPGSHYTAAHLDRLRLIARLKAAYLPLKEIRRRLAGQDDAEV